MNNDSASRREERPLISIVVPCYNEEAVIECFFREMVRELEKLQADWEIICVDDGSCDRTLHVLLEIARSNSSIKVIKLTRNFGKESALTAGLEASAGDVVVPVDADLQDPPELIGLMLEKWREGYDVVYGARKSRVNDSLAKRVTAEKFYWLYNKLSTVTMPANTGDFRLMDRKVVERLSELPGRTPFCAGRSIILNGCRFIAQPGEQSLHKARAFWQLG